MENLIIIGSGPAGHAAAIYAGRAMLKPLMFEGLFAAGVAAGAVVGAAAASTPYYYPTAPAYPYPNCPYPDYPNCGL